MWLTHFLHVHVKEKKKNHRKATVPYSCWNTAFPTPWRFVSVFAEAWGRWLMTQGLLS